MLYILICFYITNKESCCKQFDTGESSMNSKSKKLTIAVLIDTDNGVNHFIFILLHVYMILGFLTAKIKNS